MTKRHLYQGPMAPLGTCEVCGQPGGDQSAHFFNGSGEPCDNEYGHCACGALHQGFATCPCCDGHGCVTCGHKGWFDRTHMIERREELRGCPFMIDEDGAVYAMPPSAATGPIAIRRKLGVTPVGSPPKPYGEAREHILVGFVQHEDLEGEPYSLVIPLWRKARSILPDTRYRLFGFYRSAENWFIAAEMDIDLEECTWLRKRWGLDPVRSLEDLDCTLKRLVDPKLAGAECAGTGILPGGETQAPARTRWLIKMVFRREDEIVRARGLVERELDWYFVAEA